MLLGVDSSGGILSTMTNHDLQLRTGNSTKLIVKAGGNVGIGLDAPAAPLHVADHAVVGPFLRARILPGSRRSQWNERGIQLH
jgi:hypothetical protein